MFESLQDGTSVLLGTTAAVATVHALLGVDHSLPFIVLGRSRRWTLGRTMGVTMVCGVGHVASSVVIGGVGAVAGATLDLLAWVESARGEVAAALLISFGLAYAAWAMSHKVRGVQHSHVHADGTVHTNPHVHHGEHLHPHLVRSSITPWALFVIFVLGPCEPLIPLMMVPAMSQSWLVVAGVVGVFAVLTVATMAATVAVGYRGLSSVTGRRLAPHADVVAGLVVAASGAAVLLLGL